LELLLIQGGSFAAVIDRVTDAFSAQLSVMLNPSGSIEMALRRFCLKFVHKVSSAEAIALQRLIMGESSRFPEIGRMFYDKGHRQTHELLANFLSDGMGNSVLRRGDPLAAARELIALCLSGEYQQMLMGVIEELKPKTLAADVERAIEIFTRSYALNSHR
jgi:TetR/AcrR family transcriptional regulator, mexJK operon transcriptional repressor